MKINRIWGIILRFLFNFKHSLDRVVDIFYWPTVDLVLWGVTSSYFSSFSSEPSGITLAVVSGIVFWLVLYRAQYEVAGNLLEELWNKNLVNIFVSPLKFSEWICSFITLGIVKGFFSFSFAAFLAYALYKVQIFAFGFYLLPFIVSLLLMGWWMGFLVSGIILRFGTKVQAFAWTVVWAFAPFAAIYYPVSALPQWAGIMAQITPASYIFEGMRQVLFEGTLNWNYFYISLGLNIIYLFVAIIFLKRSFSVVRNRGMVKLY